MVLVFVIQNIAFNWIHNLKIDFGTFYMSYYNLIEILY